MNIKNTDVEFNGIPLKIELCKIRHMHPHFHETAMEFVYCLEGTVNLYNGFQNFTISEGEICSIDCRDIHCFHSDEENLVMFCYIDLTSRQLPFEYLKHVFFACETINSYPYQKASLEWLERTFLSLTYAQYGNNDSMDYLNYSAIADEIISVMMRYFNYYTYLNYDGYINQALFDRYHNIMIYCHKNFKEKINISQLADMEHLSKNSLSQFIRKTNLLNFNSTIKFIRCYEAEHLFLTSDISITEASYACGFSDPKYFYSFFKSMWKRTPKQHRKWYENFIEQKMDVKYLSKDEICSFIKEFLPEWLTRKTLMSF